MNVGREVFEFLKAGAIAHAKWDYEVSMSIVQNRKKMLIILSMLLPIFAVAICEGGWNYRGQNGLCPGPLHHDDLPGLHRHRPMRRADHRLHRRRAAASSSPRP